MVVWSAVTGIVWLVSVLLATIVAPGQEGDVARFLLVTMITTLVGSLTFLYFGIVTGRLLGLLYRQGQRRLAWFQIEE